MTDDTQTVIEQVPGTPAAAQEPPMTESQVREAASALERSEGIVRDEVSQTEIPAAPGAGGDVSAGVTPQAPVPGKFLKPDGTADVDKIKASTRQLDEGIEKAGKSVEDYLAQYREKEKLFHETKRKEASLRQDVVQPAYQPPAPVVQPPPSYGVPNDELQVRKKIEQDLQQDPIGTIVDLVRIVSRKEMEPIQRWTEELKAKEREESIRANVLNLAKSDPRILDPQIFSAINQKLADDPSLWNTKNPHRAAWLDVKEELRLGDVNRPTTVSQRTPAPILGGGAPPPVPNSSGPVTVGSVFEAIRQSSTSDEMKKLEDQLRSMELKGVVR